MGSDRIKVLYIAGEGRSGSTILGNILGQLNGFFHVGELCYVWSSGLVSNGKCGCGARFRDCPLWRAALEKAFGGMDQVNALEMAGRHNSLVRTMDIPRILLPGGQAFVQSRLGEYIPNLEKLYLAVADGSRSNVIVDSSKLLVNAYILRLLPKVDGYVVHLVRDPRAVAYSWMRKKHNRGNDTVLPQKKPAKIALRWNIWNLGTLLSQKPYWNRYLPIRYEDFVDQPKSTIIRILDFLQEDVSGLPFTGDREVELTRNHTVWGNPNRFEGGRVTLRSDDEWLTKMKWRHRILVSLITSPLLLWYGYSFTSSPHQYVQ